MVFTVESTLADDLKKPASDYRQKDVFEFRAFTAKRVDITRGGQTYAFAQTSPASRRQAGRMEAEEAGRKTLDATKTNDMFGNFSNLRADSFVDAAGAGPETTITATFGEGAASRTETVTFREVPAKAAAKTRDKRRGQGRRGSERRRAANRPGDAQRRKGRDGHLRARLRQGHGDLQGTHRQQVKRALVSALFAAVALSSRGANPDQ